MFKYLGSDVEEYQKILLIKLGVPLTSAIYQNNFTMMSRCHRKSFTTPLLKGLQILKFESVPKVAM